MATVKLDNFLTEEQQSELGKHDWQLIDSKDGTKWFGSDFDEGWLHRVTETLEINNDCDGMDFLVIGYKPTFKEEGDDNDKTM